MKIHSFTGGLAGTNAWLAEIGESRLLFDAPTDTAHWLSEIEIQPTQILLTHQHWDHVQDLAAVVEASGAPVSAWSGFEGEELTLAARFEQNFGIPCEVPDYSVDQVLEGKKELELEGLTLGLRHVPGHSPDSVCFLLEDVLVCGDTVMAGGIGRTDLPHSEPEIFIEAIQREIMSLPDETRLLPGHGPEGTVGQDRGSNPFLQEM